MAVQDGGMFQDLMARLAGTAGAAGPAARSGVEAIKRRPGTAAALGTAAVMAPGAIQQGLGGIASLGAGLAGGALASQAARLIPGPAGAVARVAAPILGTLGASAAAEELLPRALAGVPGKEEVQQRELQERGREFERQQLQADVAARSASELAATREMIGYVIDKEIEQQKAMLPIMERMQRNQLVNAQAMLASQTAAYQQLGRTAIAGKLALGGQAERGATMRTALATNPYMGSVIQAPSISF